MTVSGERAALPVGFPTQAQVLAWVAERWPDRTTTIWRAAKLCEESGEVMGAVIKMDEGRKTVADLRQESAQALICILGVAESAGFDVFEAVAQEYHRCTHCSHCGGPLDKGRCQPCIF